MTWQMVTSSPVSRCHLGVDVTHVQLEKLPHVDIAHAENHRRRLYHAVFAKERFTLHPVNDQRIARGVNDTAGPYRDRPFETLQQQGFDAAIITGKSIE